MLYSCTAVMDHARHAVNGVSFDIKFWTDRMYGFGDITIFRFWQFGLKMHIHAPSLWVFGVHSPKYCHFIVLTPKGPSLG